MGKVDLRELGVSAQWSRHLTELDVTLALDVNVRLRDYGMLR
jgi:hypothetical protein